MKIKKVLIIGASGHSKVIIDIFEKTKGYEILGLLDDNIEFGEITFDYNILGNMDNLPVILQMHPNCELFIAIGDNWIRKKIKDRIVKIEPNIKFATAIHPLTIIGKGCSIGQGASIMAGAIIGSSVSIGDFAIVNTRASIDHDGKMEDFSSIAPNVITGSSVSIGEYTAVGISATLKHGVKIGKHSIIGAGSLLLKDCEEFTVSYGVPAKEIRKRVVGEKYL